MAAYLIADIEVHDPQAYEEYKEKASSTVKQFGGRYLARGGEQEVLEGSWTPTRLVLLEFPDMATLQAWYSSSEYAIAKPFRLTNARSCLVALEGV
ncbi:Uncharacterized conserved protein, DUF1330 family [Rhizobium mongolense subsp. loessense]|uniref:Uncharacterized conserved protein, DUF1330 family n=1 Tax=Rhizobium mongolense subsp. loessense TaxID=158890 RepID=A0A1G4QX75_9HYPH|nr:DUF1330 domain-containing protein [Rhizobium mongolense]SCW49008.1 Uncharacterized conserved protein, DUF1330 family [Rhizobium mongolense subsp. loessense]